MSTESRTPRRSPWVMLRASVPALVLAVSAAFAPAALADTTEGAAESEATPAEAIAESLGESPVHVDPAYEDAFAVEARERVAERIGESDLDLYVIVVPLTEGDTWNGESEAVASAVHDRTGGGEGHYLIYNSSGGLDGHDLGTASDDWTKPAFHGALAASYETMGGQSLIPTEVDAAVEAALSEDPEAAYEAAMADYQEERGTSDDSAPTTPMNPVLRNVGLVVLVGLVGFGISLFLVRTRRRSATPVAQHAAFDNADRARLESVVENGARDLIELGERLQAADRVDPQDLSRALDARDAAARVHDRMVAEGPTLPDAVGVLVLLDLSEDALVGRRSPRRPCYANPLHGTETKPTQWREFGGSRTIRVPLCAECARAVRGRVRPTVLPAPHDGEEIPYYEVPAEQSVWAATGYGTLRDDLVERVLRGDHSGRR
ncbi:hypothetical protein [Nocardiopsis sp. JB363]|uniref:hypothetical protein n=1 Tax=Nocardiopsis sp. JB363 TaxID=1434837 RepID=UPI001F2C69DB|nr:hypothetical protein [Nocardiopsis sp. JB363]